ncbi:helix-turn-helix domain-containing protein [Flexivirga sp. B27]
MTAIAEEPAVGELLREWRESRSLSQQALSDLSTVSTRHLSRVETGRAKPTPQMIVHLSEHLEIPLRERNRILLAGGYAPQYADSALDDASLLSVMSGLRDLLDAHLPYPALLLDDYWEVVDANSAVDALMAGCSAALLEPPINVIRLCVHPDGLAPRIRNLPVWAAHLGQQLRHRAAQTRDPRHSALAREVAELVEADTTPAVGGPVVVLELESDSGPLRFFSTAARLTTATDAALEGLHLETFLPADEHTRAAYGT